MILKISWSNGGVSTTTYLNNSIPGDGTHWRITSWSDGTTTEPGSSGSPLFDPTGHIIGQLMEAMLLVAQALTGMANSEYLGTAVVLPVIG